jgi:crossover junction endonuclease MUS81
LIISDSQGIPDFGDSQEDPYKKPATKRQKKSDSNNQQQMSQDNNKNDDDIDAVPAKKKRGGRAYVPSFRSGPYALLVALGLRESKPGYRGYMTKTELVQDSQAHCESSMTRSENPGTNYTAWTSMASLVTKGLVIKQGHPSK